jgi:hypothetical protein
MNKVIITEVFPPIPIRTYDYQAVREGYHPGDPIGHGRTPDEAGQDLLDEEEFRLEEIGRRY